MKGKEGKEEEGIEEERAEEEEEGDRRATGGEGGVEEGGGGVKAGRRQHGTTTTTTRGWEEGTLGDGVGGGAPPTCVTRGCSSEAEPLPTQRTAKRRQRQQRSTMRLSAWCVFSVSDSTGQI